MVSIHNIKPINNLQPIVWCRMFTVFRSKEAVVGNQHKVM